ncbi:DUF429 domain-containing protein [Salinicoccus halitifaciens]|uniref:RNase H-like nuclease n=1 Tax=Salinicoccus halitifaciens TaxID=1073415 RepID=A0ABV2EB70_9STAP|nr:DUF429 domain-containing protein [Salinicoccus halitifaciens]MCD2137502.1 DUF429 domain-containing protein [Salinicoccus halitifaciens]
MKYVGIDLAWTYKNETGICILDDAGRVVHLDAQVYTNKELLEIIKTHHDGDMIIAVDAPLVVNNEGGSRGAEGEMMRAKINGHRLRAFNANRNYFLKVFGEIRGETLMHMIRDAIPDSRIGFGHDGTSIVETFPTGIIAGLFPEIAPVKYKRKPKATAEETVLEMGRLLERFSRLKTREGDILDSRLSINEITTGASLKHLEDKVDAFLCAFGMYAIHKGIAVERTFGTVDRGFITIPVQDGLKKL